MGTGCMISLGPYDGDEDTRLNNHNYFGEYYIVLYGDTTGDGRINAIDALALIKHINNKISFTDDLYKEAGRIITTGEENPTAVDALAIIKHSNGKIPIQQLKA